MGPGGVSVNEVAIPPAAVSTKLIYPAADPTFSDVEKPFNRQIGKCTSTSKLILSSLQLVLGRVAAVKCFPVHHHSADYIFSGPLGSLGSF